MADYCGISEKCNCRYQELSFLLGEIQFLYQESYFHEWFVIFDIHIFTSVNVIVFKKAMFTSKKCIPDNLLKLNYWYEVFISWEWIKSRPDFIHQELIGSWKLSATYQNGVGWINGKCGFYVAFGFISASLPVWSVIHFVPIFHPSDPLLCFLKWIHHNKGQTVLHFQDDWSRRIQ